MSRPAATCFPSGNPRGPVEVEMDMSKPSARDLPYYLGPEVPHTNPKRQGLCAVPSLALRAGVLSPRLRFGLVWRLTLASDWSLDVECFPQRGESFLAAVVVHHDAQPHLAGVDHPNVDAALRQGPEHSAGHPGMRT